MLLTVYLVVAAVVAVAFFLMGVTRGWWGSTVGDHFLLALISGTIGMAWIFVAGGLGLALLTALVFRFIGPRTQLSD